MDQFGNVGLKPHRGGMLLTFGILGFFCCIIFAILAWVMGNGDLKEMAEGRMDPSGEGLTKAGKILGMVSCGLAVLGILLWIGLFAMGMSGAVAKGMH